MKELRLLDSVRPCQLQVMIRQKEEAVIVV